jgi:hypothetical protein
METTKITIQDRDEKKALIELHKRLITEIELSNKDIFAKYKRSKARLKELLSDETPNQPYFVEEPTVEYNRRPLSIHEKASKALEKLRVFSTSRQIGNAIAEEEGTTKQEDISVLVAKLSAILKQKMDKGQFNRITYNSEYLYGLPSWFDNDGNAKDEFKSKAHQ